mgnify:CR=1 FL=1
MTTLYEKAPAWEQPAAGRCRPGMTELRNYLLATFPHAVNLGCYGDRAKTGGSTPSLHRDGRAIDIGWLDDGTLYLAEREEAFAHLVEHADALGLQIVLNYRRDGFGGTRWRLPYYVGDPKAGLGTWSSPGHWLHIERTNAGADDKRAIADIIGAGTPAPPAPPTSPPPAPAPPSSTPRTATVTVDLPIITPKSSSSAPAVEQIQHLLNFKGNQGLTVDGDYGPKTQKAVRNWQTFFGLKVDAQVGPITWSSLLAVYG